MVTSFRMRTKSAGRSGTSISDKLGESHIGKFPIENYAIFPSLWAIRNYQFTELIAVFTVRYSQNLALLAIKRSAAFNCCTSLA